MENIERKEAVNGFQLPPNASPLVLLFTTPDAEGKIGIIINEQGDLAAMHGGLQHALEIVTRQLQSMPINAQGQQRHPKLTELLMDF
jgi:hypothetical protein